MGVYYVFQRTPLHIASEHGHLNIVELLLINGASIYSMSLGNYTPLHFASLNGHLSTVEYLISHGADVNAIEDYVFD